MKRTTLMIAPGWWVFDTFLVTLVLFGLVLPAYPQSSAHSVMTTSVQSDNGADQRSIVAGGGAIRNGTEGIGNLAWEFYQQQSSGLGGGGGAGAEAIRERFFTGAAAGDRFGWSVASAGDVNGDGYSDVIVGAPANSAGGPIAGRAYVYFGGPGMDTFVDVILTGAADIDFFATSVSTGGDLNADGYSDVIVGAESNDAGGTDAGRAYVYFGGANMDNVADVILTGAAAFDQFGTSVASAGDVNGDGYSEVVVGANFNDAGGTDAGAAYVYFGGPSMDTVADVILIGAAGGDFYGTSVASAGDVNGDGYSEVIVGAYGNDAGGTEAGRAYVYFGGPSMDNVADVIFTGAAAGDLFGWSVAGAGDVNGDGYSEVIVGAQFNDAGGTDAGRAYVYFGGLSMNNVADVILTGAAAGDQFGYSVASAGDVNGDGYYEVVVGALVNDASGLDAGRAYLYFGGAGMDDVVDVVLSGAAAGDQFGFSVASAGDMTGNGYSDVIVGAPANSAGGALAGRAYLYLNSLTDTDIPDEFFTGAAELDHFGYSVASAGDVNGDGYSEVIVGAYRNDAGGTDAGRAYVYFGGAGMDNVADVILTGAGAGELFGYSVASAGDVNGDGYSELIVGAYLNDAGGTDAGRAYVYFGGAGMDNVADVILTGDALGDRFGFSVASAGDVNADGYSEVIVGAYRNDAGGADAGRVYVYFGGPSMDNVADVILTGAAASDEFGLSVASAGDVNGDGYSEVIVGANGNDAGGADAGRAYVYFGGASMDDVADVILTGDALGDRFGISVASAGDVNGDGYSEVIVGAHLNDAGGGNAGRAYVYFGGAGMDNVADVNLTGAAAVDLFGVSVASAGDVNGDGYSEVIVGARLNDAGGTDAGRAYVYFGGAGMDNVADVILTGAAAGEFFGWSVASAGDVNGDGYSDVIVGAEGNDAGGTNAGRAYLYLSSSPVIVPRIMSVKDVPHDQGGRVLVRWMRSGYDAPGIGRITDYVIQRSLPPGQTGFAWQNLATMVATQEPVYSYAASTLYDSSMNTSGTFYFRVIARTSNPNEYWRSTPVAGHSVDNLPPEAPANVLGDLMDGNVVLHWNPNLEPDLSHYEVYRSVVPDFEPDTMSAYDTTQDTLWTDTNVLPMTDQYYALRAVDVHGNRSLKSNEVAIVLVSVPEEATVPVEFALLQNYPNPFNPSTKIRYELPKQSYVVLRIFNLLGQPVATLVDAEKPAGRYEGTWNASGFASGVYFYKLQAEDFIQIRKLILLR